MFAFSRLSLEIFLEIKQQGSFKTGNFQPLLSDFESFAGHFTFPGRLLLFVINQMYNRRNNKRGWSND
jgi:hypothetical protein